MQIETPRYGLPVRGFYRNVRDLEPYFAKNGVETFRCPAPDVVGRWVKVTEQSRCTERHLGVGDCYDNQPIRYEQVSAGTEEGSKVSDVFKDLKKGNDLKMPPNGLHTGKNDVALPGKRFLGGGRNLRRVPSPHLGQMFEHLAVASTDVQHLPAHRELAERGTHGNVSLPLEPPPTPLLLQNAVELVVARNKRVAKEIAAAGAEIGLAGLPAPEPPDASRETAVSVTVSGHGTPQRGHGLNRMGVLSRAGMLGTTGGTRGHARKLGPRTKYTSHVPAQSRRRLRIEPVPQVGQGLRSACLSLDRNLTAAPRKGRQVFWSQPRQLCMVSSRSTPRNVSGSTRLRSDSSASAWAAVPSCAKKFVLEASASGIEAARRMEPGQAIQREAVLAPRVAWIFSATAGVEVDRHYSQAPSGLLAKSKGKPTYHMCQG